MNRLVLCLCTILFYVSMSGAYYDMWWHVVGRVETFFTPAHLVIYAGIFFVGMAVLITVIRSMIQLRTWRPSQIPHHRALALTGGGSCLQLLSGVSDGFYHEWIGFDITIWSPPHLGAIFGGVLIGLGLAMLWWQLFDSWKRIVGASAALGCVLSLHQFTLAEYNVMDRFDEYPAWFAFFISLMFGFTMLWARRNLGRGLATSMMLWLTAGQMVVWALWTPLENLQSGRIDLYPFPYLYLGAGILFDGIDAWLARRGKMEQRWSSVAAWIYFGGLNVWLLWSTGREVNEGIVVTVFALSALGWVLAEGLCRVVSGFGNVPWRSWGKQLWRPTVQAFPAIGLGWSMLGWSIMDQWTRTSFAHSDHEVVANETIKYAESIPAWAVACQFILMMWIGFSLAEGLANWNRTKGRERE